MLKPKSPLLDFLLVLSLFGSARVFTRNPVEIYVSYIPIVILMPFFLRKYRMPKNVVYLFLGLLVTSAFNVFLGNNALGLFLKVFLGLFFSYYFYYGIISTYKYDVHYLFKLYLKASIVISLIGLFQFVSYQIGFFPGYTLNFLINKGGFTPGGNFGIRVSSIFSEPTYFATFIAPALFIAFNDLFSKHPYFFKKRTTLLIISVFLLTFSGNAYNALFIIAFLFIYNLGLIRYSLIGIPIIIAGYFYSYNNIYEFKARVDGTIYIFESGGKFTIGETHGSSVNLYDNFQVAFNNFYKNPLFGTGIGSHPIAFDKYTITKHITQEGFAFNRMDANSMFLRTISETGLLGISILIIILFRYFVHKNNAKDEQLWLISNSIVVLILLNFIRQGHYFLYGFPFYIWLYYYVWKRNNELGAQNSE